MGKKNTSAIRLSGGQRVLNPIQIHNKNSTRLVEKSVRGMLPKNKWCILI